jgi:raffinose/stachyose/melibiose transport system permease protein
MAVSYNPTRKRVFQCHCNGYRAVKRKLACQYDIVMLAVFAAITWKYFGFHMLLYLTACKIFSETKKPAKMAPIVPKFLLHYLAFVSSTIRTSVYLCSGSIQQFILVWIMTKGDTTPAKHWHLYGA